MTDESPAPLATEHDVTVTVDGTEESMTVESRTLLVHALRDVGYTAPNVGCETGKCGACTVHLDGDAVKSCTVLAVQADGSSVTTATGIADEASGDLHPVQSAFREEHALQCGYCTPGMVATATDLLEETDEPSRDEIRTALKGNVCRCTGYQNIVDAVERVSTSYSEASAADGGTERGEAASVEPSETAGDESAAGED